MKYLFNRYILCVDTGQDKVLGIQQRAKQSLPSWGLFPSQGLREGQEKNN